MTIETRNHLSRSNVPSRRTLDRNWDELMQELRATQTGVQILTGFLLTSGSGLTNEPVDAVPGPSRRRGRGAGIPGA